MAQVKEKIQKLTRPAQQLSKAAEKVEDITKEASEESTPKVEIKSSPLKTQLLGYTPGLIAGAIETVVLLYFLLASGDLFMAKLVRVLPTLHDKKQAVEIIKEIQTNISRFIFTVALINACFGTILGIAAKLMGLPHPVLWGFLAGALNFIPYFGPLGGMLAFGFAGLMTFDSAWHAAFPALLYLGLHALESNLITPLILGHRLTLNPVVIFVSLIFWTWVWGIPGALLAIPMLMMLKVFCDRFKPLAPVGEFLGG
jgi:predicted PurR-regulated permease PerM